MTSSNQNRNPRTNVSLILLTHESSLEFSPVLYERLSPDNSLTGCVTSCHSCVLLTSCTTGSVSQEPRQQRGCKPGQLVTDLWHTAQLWLNIGRTTIKKYIRVRLVVCVASCQMLNQNQSQNPLLIQREIVFGTVLHSTNTILYIVQIK